VGSKKTGYNRTVFPILTKAPWKGGRHRKAEYDAATFNREDSAGMKRLRLFISSVQKEFEREWAALRPGWLFIYRESSSSTGGRVGAGR